MVDGAELTHSKVTEAEADYALSRRRVRLHVLTDGCGFDLADPTPKGGSPE